MKINLLTHDNGVGLTQDVKIIKDVLKGHDIQFIDLRGNGNRKADVNIFFEILDGRHYDNAKYNLFFPNPEWFWWPKQLAAVDIVLAKTHDAERIFKALVNSHTKVIYTSFTSDDRFKDIERERVYLHTAGQSETKGTQTVFAAWQRNYPRMILTKLKNYAMYDVHLPNILTCWERLPFETLVNIQNKCLFHLCPSEYEGFGHYIWEAFSCGNIVITTDAPPMNEFVTDGVDGFLVNAPRKRKMNFAKCSGIERISLQQVIEKTMQLTDEQIQKMRLLSRLKWEDNDKFFRETLNQIINKL